MDIMQQKLMELNANRNPQAAMILKGTKKQEINSSENFAEDSDNTIYFNNLLEEVDRSYPHLPEEFKKAMVGLKVLHNTPYEFSSSMLLGMANSCMHHLYDVDSYKYGVRPTSIYMLLLLGTGGSKSTIYNELKQPIVEHTKHMLEQLKDEEAKFASAKKAYKKELDKYEKDLANNLSPSFPQSPKPPETAYYLNSKFTVNGLIDILENQPFTCIHSAEAGVFFTSHAFQNMKQDGTRATEMTATLTTAWDGDTLIRNIKGERLVLNNRRVNSLLLVQEHVVRDVLNNKMFQEQGFIHRILISQIPLFDKPKMSLDKIIVQRENQARNLIKPYLDKLDRLLYNRPTMVEDKNFELNPKIITSNNDALQLMFDFYNQTTEIGKPGNKLERYEGFANRLHEHMIRIAATLAAFNDNDVVEITESEAKASIDYMNMFIEHRAGLEMGITDTNPVLTQSAETLEAWFKKRTDQPYTIRELSRLGPSGFRNITEEQRKTIIAELVEREILVAIEDLAKNGKKILKFKFNQE